MTPRLAFLLSLVLATGLAAAAGPAPAATPSNPQSVIQSGPAIGWSFPIFTDKHGYHLLTLRGSKALIEGPDRIQVTDFSAFMFSGDASERVDTILVSPQATFFPKEYRAMGDSSVRLIHDDVEVSGVGWTYDHKTKKVFLAHDARVTLHVHLNDILK